MSKIVDDANKVINDMLQQEQTGQTKMGQLEILAKELERRRKEREGK